MELADFMERVGATDTTVALVVKRNRSTIWRIRRHETKPDFETLIRLNQWADRVARDLHLQVDERLTWDHLLSDDAA